MGNPLTMYLVLWREYSGKGSLQVCCATHIHQLATAGERMYLDEPLDRYWLLLLAFEMTGGNGTAISRSTNR